MNKNKIILTGAIVLALSAIIGSCVKDKGKTPSTAIPSTTTTTGGPGGPVPCDSVTFTKHIKPITDNNCALSGCHNGGNSNPVLMSYSDVKSQADAGRIKARVIDENPSRMPAEPNKPLTEEQKRLITCWLNNGKKQ